jgi:hypothetical protein
MHYCAIKMFQMHQSAAGLKVFILPKPLEYSNKVTQQQIFPPLISTSAYMIKGSQQ